MAMGSVKFLKRIKEKTATGGWLSLRGLGAKRVKSDGHLAGGGGRRVTSEEGTEGVGGGFREQESGHGKDLLTSASFNVIADAISKDFLLIHRYDHTS